MASTLNTDGSAESLSTVRWIERLATRPLTSDPTARLPICAWSRRRGWAAPAVDGIRASVPVAAPDHRWGWRSTIRSEAGLGCDIGRPPPGRHRDTLLVGGPYGGRGRPDRAAGASIRATWWWSQRQCRWRS